MVPDRLARLGRVTALALAEMRRAPPADRDLYSVALANIMVRELGEQERAFLLATAAKAAPEHVLDRMVFELGGPAPFNAGK